MTPAVRIGIFHPAGRGTSVNSLLSRVFLVIVSLKFVRRSDSLSQVIAKAQGL